MTGGKPRHRCGEKRWEKGKQKGRGDHRERLACVSFDGLYPSQFLVPYLTATSIKAGVGSRMGLPPTKGQAEVTCPAHTIDVASQVSTQT